MTESSPGASALLNSASPAPNSANTPPLESLGTRDRIVELLKAGVATGQIAEACGVSDGYVSQVKSDPGVALQIAEARAGDLKEELEHDEILNRAEMKALRAIDRQIEMVPFSQKLAAFRILNSAERRSAPGGANQGVYFLRPTLQSSLLYLFHHHNIILSFLSTLTHALTVTPPQPLAKH